MKKKFAFALAASLVMVGASASFTLAAPPVSTAESAADSALSGHASVNAGGIETEGTVAEKDSKDKSPAKKRPHMDVAFCIDTTGSMQGEIDMVKKKTKEMVAKLSAGKPTPVIRVGLVAYRDKGDAYVTKVFQFSDDIDKVVKDISELQANGGGDGPEAVDQGLHAAIKDLKWDKDSHTAKILFLIGDAGPHGYSTDVDWRQDCRDAIANGIQINTMGCRGLENYPSRQGVDVFKEIAQLADGKYESLAYRQEIVDASGKRETLVHSAGAVYKVAAPATVGWKDAMARGMVKKFDGPSAGSAGAADAAMPMAAPMAAFSSFEAGGTRAKSASMHGTLMRATAGAPVSREDNNLDALMLDAAKNKAAKSLHIDY